MTWVDLLIALFVVYGGMISYFRGLALVGADLVGFILAAVVAGLTYRWFAPGLGDVLRIIPSFAQILSYALVFILVELVINAFSHHHLIKVSKRWQRAALSRYGGLVAGTAKQLLLVTISLIILTGLPVSAARKRDLTSGTMSAGLLRAGSGLQQTVNGVIGASITDVLNFFTVRTTSTDFIQLGFNTTRVAEDPAAETAMLNLVNRERTSRGLRPLVVNQTAQAVARAHSRDMFARGYFSHYTPEGRDPFDRMTAGGVEFAAAGENLALAPTLEQAHNGLMNSPGHRANILSPDYRAVGIGVIDGGRYGLMITQNFTD